MNIIKTVGDLKKAMSVYADDAPFEICMIDGTARTNRFAEPSTTTPCFTWKRGLTKTGEVSKCFVISAIRK